MLKKLLLSYLSIILSVLVFSACEETTTTTENPLVTGPDSMKATSINETTVRLRWKLSNDESKSYFKDYVLYITPGAFQPKVLSKGTNTIDVTGLTDGTIYTFELKARNTDDKESVTSASIKWSPAFRFTTNINDEPIRIYETASLLGSGLELYEPTSGKPKTLKVASGEFWNLGLYTKNNEISIYSANYMYNNSLYNFPVAPSYTTEISEDIFLTNTLDNVFDSQALNVKNFSSNYFIDLTDPDLKNGVVFIVRTKATGQTDWNYAKVLVKAGASGLLQGTADNRYVELVISYQKKAGVPYAKTID
ncbi:MAG: fibronectin type III domain-containing protein [Candidatus Kapaibacteriales bacterium]